MFFLRYYQKTKEFDQTLPQRSTLLIKYAIGLHFFVSILAHIRSDIFDDDVVSLGHFDNSIQDQKSFVDRLKKDNHIAITIVLFLGFVMALELQT